MKVRLVVFVGLNSDTKNWLPFHHYPVWGSPQSKNSIHKKKLDSSWNTINTLFLTQLLDQNSIFIFVAVYVYLLKEQLFKHWWSRKIFFFSFQERGREGNKSFALKEVPSQVQLLTRLSNHFFFGQKIFLFCVASIAKKWYSFQMPSLELKRGFKCIFLYI